MPSVTIRNASNYACHHINLVVNDKELLVILGPNGSGKTTLLNVIAGLVDYKGTVLFDGTPVDRIPANKRGVGYLFQNLLLFPHMNVTANIAYSLKVNNWPQSQIEEKVRELLKLVNIEHLASRFPAYLSGGERQRVALARALAISPKVLLLDEPLSSLDFQTAKYLRLGLKEIQRTLGITTICVTHNLDEAEEIADRIAILYDGNLEQVGKPHEIFFFPENDKVSEFIGRTNILKCDYCTKVGHGIMEVGCGGLSIIVPHDGKVIDKIALFPRDIYVSNAKLPGPEINRFKGTVTAIKMAPESIRINIKAGNNNLLSEIPRYIFEDLNLAIGDEVFLIFKLRRIRIYENSNS